MNNLMLTAVVVDSCSFEPLPATLPYHYAPAFLIRGLSLCTMRQLYLGKLRRNTWVRMYTGVYMFTYLRSDRYMHVHACTRTPIKLTRVSFNSYSRLPG